MRYQDYLIPCCGGWHVEHIRVRIGSYHHWVLQRLWEMVTEDP